MSVKFHQQKSFKFPKRQFGKGEMRGRPEESGLKTTPGFITTLRAMQSFVTYV